MSEAWTVASGPPAWLGICKSARANGQKDCTPLRQLIRILDGQASWYDKSPAEEHRSKCLHCLELWTSLLEVVAWDRARQPWPADKVEPCWRQSHLNTGSAQVILVRPGMCRGQSRLPATILFLMRNYRQEFSDFSPLVYLDCSYQGPFPRVTVERIQRAMELKMPPGSPEGSRVFWLAGSRPRANRPT